MKLARFDIETIGFVNKTEKFHINSGDSYQNIIIKDIYKRMGVLDDVYVLDFNEITTYRGEKLIIPINQALSHSLPSYISPDIIPIFLGLSRDTSAINDEELMYYKRFQPIGCRDEELFQFLKEKGIDAYLAGCLTVTATKREYVSPDAHPIIIDLPEYVLDKMPKEIKEKAEILTNVFYGDYKTIVGDCESFEERIRNRYRYYSENASIIITSRMHVASPCIGMGIPVILARNSVDYRLSWIDKFTRIFTKDTIDEIDWNPKPYDDAELENIKENIIQNAIVQIESVYKAYKHAELVSNIYESRQRQQYEKHSFTEFAIRFIKSKWKSEDSFDYSLWGLNDAADVLYSYISTNYPNARLQSVYDSYKSGLYQDMTILSPTEIQADHCFVFVTGYTASDAAKDMFRSIGMNSDNYFLFDHVVRDNESRKG